MAGAKAGKGKGAMAFIVTALLLTLVGAGAGLSVGALLQKAAQPESSVAPATAVVPDVASKEASAAEHGTTEDEPADVASNAPVEEPAVVHTVKAVPFPPVLTTLAAPKGKWIRVEGSILAALETEDSPELLAEKAGEQIFNYLHSVRLDQIEGPSGVLGLGDDLDEMVRVLSNGQVQGVLIRGLVVE